uniref:F5/8 type C domain-containing protein n=1 Tax=Meloidogyne incognita TaxID=6306 RepID=A0A914NAX6_MELIC
MESGRILDEQISASSSFDPLSTSPIHSRPIGSKGRVHSLSPQFPYEFLFCVSKKLNTESGSGAWCPSSQINATSHEWIQVELADEYFIVGVRTQGRWDKGRGLEFPSAYMIEYWRPSLGRWARYKDSTGNEIISANSNTQTAVLRLLDGGIIAKLVRLIPVSESIRTVCLRFELYGCLYKEPILSYSAPTGDIVDALDLRDISYDGWTVPQLPESSKNLNNLLSDIVWLRGGLGQLFDGIKGKDNFEEFPSHWIGWHKSQKIGQFIPLEFLFKRKQNLSAILLHTSNFRKRGAHIFSSARLHFSPLGGEFSTRIIEKKFPEDSQFENARWIRIPIPQRIASHLRIELFFGLEADWLLLSEIKFETEDESLIDNYDLLQNEKDLLLTSSYEDDESDYIEFSSDDNIINKSIICYLMIIFIFLGLCLSITAFCLCLRSIFFSSRQKRSPPKSTSKNCYKNGTSSLTSKATISFNNSSSTLRHSKSLLLQQLLQGARRKIETKKGRLCSSQSHVLLKIPFDSVDDKEQQNELIDIARLVLHHNKNDNKILNDNESQYADPDDTQNYLKNCKQQFPIATIRRPSLLHYATRDLFVNDRTNQTPFEERILSPTFSTDFLSQQRYLGTPTMANFPPLIPLPPPLPSLPPPNIRLEEVNN